MARRRPPSSPAAFLQMLGQQEDAEAPSFPMKEAQREMLAIAVDRSRLPHQTFVCGDAVQVLARSRPNRRRGWFSFSGDISILTIRWINDALPTRVSHS